MRIFCPLCVVGVTVAMLHVSGGQAAAQVELTGTASVINVPGGAFGLGGRLGVPIRDTFERGIRLEGAVEYFWPSCTTETCDLLTSHMDVVFQNRFGGEALAYFGGGATYQNYALIENGTFSEGTRWGGNFVLGSRTQSEAMLRPFVEVRWTLLSNVRDQWTFTLGGAFVLGG